MINTIKKSAAMLLCGLMAIGTVASTSAVANNTAVVTAEAVKYSYKNKKICSHKNKKYTKYDNIRHKWTCKSCKKHECEDHTFKIQKRDKYGRLPKACTKCGYKTFVIFKIA